MGIHIRLFFLSANILSTLMVGNCNAALTMSITTHQPRTFLITGTTDGIGKHTCQKLASPTNALLIHGRKSPSDPIVKSLIHDLESRGAAQVAYLQADLNDLRQVERLAEEAITQLQSWQQPSSSVEPSIIPSLDVLINNAGAFDPTPRTSAQGYDATMAINVLAPYLLTRRLLPSLVRGASGDVRIVTTSSVSQSRTLPELDALFATASDTAAALPYSAHSYYSYSKLGVLLFNVKLAKLLSAYQNDTTTDTTAENNPTTTAVLQNNMHRIQCLTMDPGTVNTKMLLAGWGPCGIPVEEADNTYLLATCEEYAFDHGGKEGGGAASTTPTSSVKSGSYHFGWGASKDATDERKLKEFWEKLGDCTGVEYDDLSDCF